KAIGTGDFSGAYQNPASEWLMQIEENSEEWFPNFYTAYEKQHPVLSMFSSYGFANMFGDKFLKNLGFTAGAVGAAYVQSLLTAGIGSALGRLGLTSTNIARTITTTGGRVANIAGKTGDFALDLGKVITTSENAGKSLAEVTQALSKGGKIAELRKIAKTAANLRKINSISQYAGSLWTSANGEASFEAHQGYQNLKDELIKEYKQKNATDNIPEDVLSDIDKTATAAGNAR